MVFHTRYRDIPWSEIENAAGHHVGLEPPERTWENYHRGRPVSVITPPGSPNHSYGCTGPHYKIAWTADYVCPHIAEIGD